MTAVGPGPTVYEQTGDGRHPARQPLDQQRAAQHLPRPATATGSRSPPAPRRSPSGCCAWSATPRSIDEPWFASGHTRAAARRPARRVRRRLDRRRAPATRWSRRSPRPAPRSPRSTAPATWSRTRTSARPGCSPRSTTPTSAPVLQHNVMWRMSETPGPDPLHRPRRSAPTPTPCSASSASPADEIAELRAPGGHPMNDATAQLLDAVGAGAPGRRPRAARSPSGCRSRPTTRRTGTRSPAATATWSAPTAARRPTT